LSSSEKDGLHIQTILFKESLLFTNPNMALGKGQRWIAYPDFLEFLGNRGSGSGYEDKEIKGAP
jgi:hypothetical protein